MKKAYFFVALFLLVVMASAQVNDAQHMLRSISAVPEYHSPLLPLLTEGRIHIMYTKEERAQKKIRSITECVDNNWAGLSKQKWCIKNTYDAYGNITSAVKTDSSGKTVMAYNCSNKTDEKGNVTSSKITVTGGTVIDITQTFNEKGLVTMRQFSALVPALPGEREEPEIIEPEEELPKEDYNYVENYTYDDTGHLLSYSTTHGWTKETMSFTWNQHGQLLTREHRIMTKVHYREEISHNKTHVVDSVATRTYGWSYEYDPASGYLLVIHESRSDFPVPGTLNYTYDKAGNITTLHHTFSQPAYNSKEVSYFDKQGRKVKTELYGGKIEALSSASTIEYSTSANGNEIRKWMSFTNTGYTESSEVYYKNSMQKELHGFYKGHTTGNAVMYHNTFRTTWTYEFYR